MDLLRRAGQGGVAGALLTLLLATPGAAQTKDCEPVSAKHPRDGWFNTRGTRA